MKLQNRNPALRVRYVTWFVLVAGLAVSAFPWTMSFVAGSGRSYSNRPQSTRSSTDPPVAARGKLGQDLFLAIDHRSLVTVQDLIKRGADPNARNGLEFTPLFVAAASHQPDVMNALLDAGAKVDADSTYGTALTFAAEGGHAEGCTILLSHGADPKVARADGTTVLMMAANSGVPDIVAELIKQKVDVNASNDSGATALSLAARHGNLEAGRLLLAAGAQVNSSDINRRTPLMEAAMNGHPDFVRILLQKGAKPNIRDTKGQTALFLAAVYGDFPEVVRALIESGARANTTDSRGRSAADIAAVRRHSLCAPQLGKPMPSVKESIPTPRTAIEKSLKLINFSTRKFDQGTTCVSCHQEGLGRITTGEALKRGFRLDPAVEKAQSGRINGMLNALKPLHDKAINDPETMKQVPLIEINEVNPIDSWVLAGMAAHNEPRSQGAEAMAMVLARQQAPDGNWSFSLPRVPMQSSFFTFTALAVRSIKTYAPKANSAEISERILRARKWLETAPVQNSEDRAFRLLGLKWAGADQASLKKAAAEVIADQHSDGGWSQLSHMQCDAYATGQALYALHDAGGIPVSNPAYKLGVKFLVRNQDGDGSWFVNKRAMPANNYFDAGFPNGESQYASFNGTCWATLALLQTLDNSKSVHSKPKR